ncbi:MAG: FAD-binding oxidoreductase [Paracoccaceae bacterium]|jgi:glycine/D-amino acid oxidase-like deaminating enzyme
MKRLYHDNAYKVAPDADNFWHSTTDTPVPAALVDDIRTDVAIIGAGYTGLNAALQLTEKFGLKTTVLDAAWAGWGASGRNGGFVGLGGAKLSDTKVLKRFGRTEAARFFKAQSGAIDLVAANLETYGIDAERCGNGEYSLAHRPSDFAAMPDEARLLKDIHGVDVPVLSAGELRERGLGSAFHGGLHIPLGFGLNPLKYVLGLAEAAERSGVEIFANSPVLSVNPEGGGFRLQTPKGSILAKKVLFATNGYSVDGMPPALSGWFLPILSNILVTRPLTMSEQQTQGWTSTELAADTRNLLHYVRLLPDGRFLFGMRGGTGLSPRDEAAMKRDIRASFENLFPAWAHIETPHFWSGLACLSRNLSAYIGPLEKGQYAALAYHGSGVAMASWAGRQVADIIAGETEAQDMPAVLRQPLKPFPLPRFRRRYLKAAYAWYGLKDR